MLRPDASALVSTDWLTQRIDAPDVRVVDATSFLPQAGRDAVVRAGVVRRDDEDMNG